MTFAHDFEWDLEKELRNVRKYGVDFETARQVFTDPQAIHLEDVKHSKSERRRYAVGKTFSGAVITVRYTLRGKTIRIIGAARWRKWRKYYDENT